MSGRRLIFSAIAAMCLCVAASAAQNESVATVIDTVAYHKYEKRIERYNRFWNGLIPDGLKLQVAGNMGTVSMGPTWLYGRNKQWETSLLLGFIPKHSSDTHLWTMTLKQDFVPWKVPLGNSGFQFQPLSTGVYFNTVFSYKFWVKQPQRYPQGYYWFSTRIRSNVFVGERLRYNIPRGRRVFARAVSVYYEISACDFAIIQKVQNKSLSLYDTLSLSFGLQVEW